MLRGRGVDAERRPVPPPGVRGLIDAADDGARSGVVVNERHEAGDLLGVLRAVAPEHFVHAALATLDHVLDLVVEEIGEDRHLALGMALLVLAGRSVGDRNTIRSEERRVGKEWVRTCRSRWSPDN